MRVDELISILQGLPPDLEVIISSDEETVQIPVKAQVEGVCEVDEHGNGKDIVRLYTETGPGDEDPGGDPTTAELLKPRGNGGIVNAEICFNALLLVGDTDATENLVQRWPQHWLDQAYDWAVRVHLNASDNDDVRVPVQPSFVPRRARKEGQLPEWPL